MYKLIFIAAFIMTIHGIQAVQVIHRSDSSRTEKETYELNQREEHQELLRRQVKIQQEMLNLQRQQQQQQEREYRSRR